MVRCIGIGALVGALVGCAGGISGGVVRSARSPARGPSLAPAARLVRLSPVQYARTIDAVATELGQPPTDSIMHDLRAPFFVATNGRFSTQANLQTIDVGNLYDALSAAESIGARLVTPARARYSCLQATPPTNACLRMVVSAVGALLWRRPLAEPEIQQFVAVAEAAAREEPTSGGAAAFAGMIFSPYFSFRTELGGAVDGRGQTSLTSYEVASALSYTLTDGPPDLPLRQAAESGVLGAPGTIHSHVARLIARDQPLAKAVRFFQEFFGFEELAARRPKLAPLAADTAALIKDLVDQNSSGLLFDAVLTDSSVYASKKTAEYYGATALDSKTPVRVGSVDGRVGLLTQPSWLAMRSIENAARGFDKNIALRGLFVLKNLLCGQVPPPPPANVPRIETAADEQPHTYRERWEDLHDGSGVCMGCHRTMDPLGFAFETFDGNGRPITEENGLPIRTDATVTVKTRSGGTVALAFADAKDLMNQLARSPVVRQCIIDQSFAYWAGRERSDADAGTTQQMLEAYAGPEGWTGHLVALFTSPSFLERSVER